MIKKIFITGATGCVGSYVIEQLRDIPNLELHLLVRDANRIQFDYKKYPSIIAHVGNLEKIEVFKDLLSEMTHIMHIATDWSDSSYARKLNLDKTHEMFDYTDPNVLEKIVYFSTASILGPGNKAIEEAGKYGQGYVKSKYRAYIHLKETEYKDKIVTVFPTLVFGGDDTHPFSHINKGVHPNISFLKWLRFIYVDGAFHFLHSKDIAAVSNYLLLNDTDKQEYALGNPSVTAKQAIETLCNTFGIPILFRLKITAGFVFTLAKIFRIVIGPWERHCINNPYMVYDTVTPETFGLKTAFPTLKSVLENIKAVGPRKKK